MTEKLIELVKKNSFLFDSKDVYYKNIAMKNKVWEEIGREINETAETAKIKWKSLRDNYGRYKKEMSDPTIQVKKFIRWPWANHLQFLDSTATEREKTTKTRGNTPPPLEFLEIALTEHETEGTSRDSNSDDSPPQTPTPVQEYAPRRKKFKRIKSEIPEKTPELDAVGHLFKSYAQTFKTFTKKNQIALKVELARLFADMEAKEMMEDSK